jgi:hypothetical protein
MWRKGKLNQTASVKRGGQQRVGGMHVLGWVHHGMTSSLPRCLVHKNQHSYPSVIEMNTWSASLFHKGVREGGREGGRGGGGSTV